MFIAFQELTHATRVEGVDGRAFVRSMAVAVR